MKQVRISDSIRTDLEEIFPGMTPNKALIFLLHDYKYRMRLNKMDK